MIYDCFQFNNELDLLEIRLNHHGAFVDKFILIESTKTYNGADKPLHFYENREKFSAFRHKIYHIITDFPFETNAGWKYEHMQRNILRGFTFPKDDLILYSDCDELVKPEVFQKISDASDIWHLQMDLFFYFFNVRLKASFGNDNYHLNPCFQNKFHMAKIIRASALLGFENIYEIRQYQIECPEQRILITNAGWHFSNSGPADRILAKFQAFSHWNEPLFNGVSKETIEKNKKELRDPLGRNVEYEIVNESDLPQYIVSNRGKYGSYFYES